MQQHNNNLTMQYACGTNQRWSNKLLKATLEYKLLKLEQITPQGQRWSNNS